MILAVTLCITALTEARAAPQLTVPLRSGFYQSVYIHRDSSLLRVAAGPFSATLNGGPSAYPTNFDVYCVDLYHWITNGDTYAVNLRPTADLLYGDRAAWLYNTYATGISTAIQGSALQIALWETVRDGGVDLSTGAFQFLASDNGGSGNTTTMAILNQANAYLTASAGQSSTGTWFEATTHPNNTRNQNMLGPPPAVPDPSSLAVLTIGMVGLALRRRRAGAGGQPEG